MSLTTTTIKRQFEFISLSESNFGNILQAGFVPGEYIHFKVDINNKTNYDLDNIRVKVVQKVQIKADGKMRSYRHSLGFMALHKKVLRQQNELWNTAYHIPPVCPTMLGQSRLLQIEYFFILFIDFDSSFSFAKEMSIPITIGTVPLHEENFLVRGDKATSTDLTGPGIPDETFEPVKNEHYKPPTYSNSDKGKALQTDLDTYKPKYPYFKEFKKKDAMDDPTE